jgi:hypothetical protein
MDNPPIETSCCNPRCILPISTRLIDIETTESLREKRKDLGLVNQMGEDHAPFAVHRTKDHGKFLDAMRQHTQAHPDRIDGEDSLVFIEEEAYNWAFDQPSLIPYWLHWKRGLPNGGIKQPSDQPLYHKSPPVLYPNNRPPPDQLPKHLQDRENEINQCLQTEQTGIRHRLSFAKLMHLHLSPMLAHEYDNIAAPTARMHCGLLTAEEVTQNMSAVQNFLVKFYNWVDSFRSMGVQIMVQREGKEEVSLPGLFYVPVHMPSEQAIRDMQEDEDMINKLLPKQYRSTEDSAKLEELLEPYIPEAVRIYRNEFIAPILKVLYISRQEYKNSDNKHLLHIKTFHALQDDERAQFNRCLTRSRTQYEDWLKWLDTPRGTSVKLIYL